MKVILLLPMLFLFCCKSDPNAIKDDNAVQTEAQTIRKDVDVIGAHTSLQSDNPPVLIDVRTPAEYAEGHIEGSLMIDYKDDTFKSEIEKLDKDATYLIYCRSGGRSAKASDYMISQGFKDVTNMKGGYLDWSEKYY